MGYLFYCCSGIDGDDPLPPRLGSLVLWFLLVVIISEFTIACRAWYILTVERGSGCGLVCHDTTGWLRLVSGRVNKQDQVQIIIPVAKIACTEREREIYIYHLVFGDNRLSMQLSGF